MRKWQTTPLSKIANIQMGQSPPGETYNTLRNGLPFFQGKAEFGEDYPTRIKWCSSPNRIAEKGDILLSVRAPVGPTNIAIEKCCIGRGLASIRTNPKVCNQQYLRYYFRRFEDDIAARGVGSTFSAINRTEIEKLELPLPPLPDQERIVKLLDEADELRKLRGQADKRSEKLIPALFEEMFLRNGRPKSVEFSKVVKEFRYGTSNKSENKGIPALRIPNVVHQEINLDDLKKVPVSDVEFERLRLKDDDMLFVRTNGNIDNVGRCAIFDSATIRSLGYDPTKFIYASYLIRARLNTEIVLPAFVNQLFTSPEGRKEIRSRCKTSAGQYNINVEGLSSLQVLIPPLPLQQEFASRVSEIRALASSQSSSRKNLDALFQSMLHRAFQGEL